MRAKNQLLPKLSIEEESLEKILRPFYYGFYFMVQRPTIFEGLVTLSIMKFKASGFSIRTILCHSNF